MNFSLSGNISGISICLLKIYVYLIIEKQAEIIMSNTYDIFEIVFSGYWRTFINFKTKFEN